MGYYMKEIRQEFKEKKEKRDLQQHGEISCFVKNLEGFKLSCNIVLKDGEKSILSHAVSHIAKCKARMHYEHCYQLFTPVKVPVKVSFENSDEQLHDPTMTAKEEFINSMSRGRLRKPSDFITLHVSMVLHWIGHLFNSDEIKSSLLATGLKRTKKTTHYWLLRGKYSSLLILLTNFTSFLLATLFTF